MTVPASIASTVCSSRPSGWERIETRKGVARRYDSMVAPGLRAGRGLKRLRPSILVWWIGVAPGLRAGRGLKQHPRCRDCLLYTSMHMRIGSSIESGFSVVKVLIHLEVLATM